MSEQMHYAGCWDMPNHGDCARAQVVELIEELDRLLKEKAVLEADIVYWKRIYDLTRHELDKLTRFHGI